MALSDVFGIAAELGDISGITVCDWTRGRIGSSVSYASFSNYP